MTVHVIPKWIDDPYVVPVVDTTSGSGLFRELSPFILGPIETYVKGIYALNFENLWQFSKVYPEHFSISGDRILPEWRKWRDAGWANPRAIRYPVGKGRRPLFSFWNRERLDYIEARKRIYASIYAKYVVKTVSYSQLARLYSQWGEVTLKDFDAYDHIAMGMSLVEVINNPDRKMGHAFVLAMLGSRGIRPDPRLPLMT